MLKNLAERENALRKFFPDLRTGISEEEIKEMEEIMRFTEEMRNVPENNEQEMSKELQNRMQNETEAGYIEVSEEQRQKWKKRFINDVN